MKIFGFVFLCLFFGIHESQAYTAKDIYAKHSGSVCSIILLNSRNEEISSGSGFIYGKNNLILTNRHVVEGGSKAVVQCGENRGQISGVVATISGVDLVVIEADRPLGIPLEIFQSSTGDVEIGDSIFVIGSPLGLSGSIVTGVISAFRQDQDSKTDFLQISAPINPGNSGGPIFSQDGFVIAVATLKHRKAEGIGFGIHIKAVKDLQFQPIKQLSSLTSIEIDSAQIDIPDQLIFSGSVVSFKGVELGMPCRTLNILSDSLHVRTQVIAHTDFEEELQYFEGYPLDIFGWSDAELAVSERKTLYSLIASGHGVSAHKASLLENDVEVFFQCRAGYFTKASYVIYDDAVRNRAIDVLKAKYGNESDVEITAANGFSKKSGKAIMAGGSSIIFSDFSITYMDIRVEEIAVKKIKTYRSD